MAEFKIINFGDVPVNHRQDLNTVTGSFREADKEVLWRQRLFIK